MADGETSGLVGEVSLSASLEVAEGVAAEEMEREEPEESVLIQRGKSGKFGYLPMMAVATLGALNAESFCERVLSCVKLVVSDLHVSMKPKEIRMLVMLRMNRDFMQYMRASYPDTPLSEFRVVDTYVRDHGGVEALEDDEDDD
jgi:hypothetical protein